VESFTIRTSDREMIMDITGQVAECVRKAGVQDGLCLVFIPHTTAGVTINENADPAVKIDVSGTLRKLIPVNPQYRHLEGNSDSHTKSTLTGSSVTIAVEEGRLLLGTWQGIQFCEYDGPRTRNVWVKTIG